MTLDEITEKIRVKIREKAGGDTGLGARLKLDFGEDGVVHLDATTVPHVVSNEDKPAECTLEASLAVFEELYRGERSPTMAMMFGDLQIHGDMSVALRMADIIND